MASRQDYEREAKAIREVLVPSLPAVLLALYVKRRADVLAEGNPRFDRDRFWLAATGMALGPMPEGVREPAGVAELDDYRARPRGGGPGTPSTP